MLKTRQKTSCLQKLSPFAKWKQNLFYMSLSPYLKWWGSEEQGAYEFIRSHRQWSRAHGRYSTQVDQKSLTWIRLIMTCYIVPWWPSLAIQNLMLFEEFQDCHHGCHLGYWNWMIQQFWISISPRWLPTSFGSTWLTVGEEMWFEEFQDGGHLGHWKRRILAILNFHITPMPLIMFKLNQTNPSVADVISRFSRWLPWWPSWISEWNHFSNAKSPCCPDAFHQVSPPSDLLFRSR